MFNRTSVFAAPPNKAVKQTIKIERKHPAVKIFDYSNDFFPAFLRYQQGEGPRPSPQVIIAFGQNFHPDSDPYTNLLLSVTVCHPQANHLLAQVTLPWAFPSKQWLCVCVCVVSTSLFLVGNLGADDSSSVEYTETMVVGGRGGGREEGGSVWGGGGGNHGSNSGGFSAAFCLLHVRHDWYLSLFFFLFYIWSFHSVSSQEHVLVPIDIQILLALTQISKQSDCKQLSEGL